jgi:DNA-binding GntR family transcriptional regulator
MTAMKQSPDGDSSYQTLAQRAYETLRDRLVMLDIAPGEPINDELLARELNTGRTPIREAIKHLERDRLVVAYPRRGTFATNVEITDLAYISEIRLELEPLAAGRAARTANAAARAQLSKLAERVAAVTADDIGVRELIQCDVDVHRAIYHAAGNPYLEDILIREDNLATRIWCLFFDRLPDVSDHIREHSKLLEAIVAGDENKAAQLARDHVSGFDAEIRAVL